MTEEERWIADAQKGDHDAFRQLWEAHHAVVMAVALRLCHHRALAEEITQGAFVLAWQRLASFKQGCSFRPWLLTLAYRHALDVMEQQQHHLRMISLENWVHQGGPREGDMFIDAQDLSEQLSRRELVRRALSSLSAQGRKVIALRYGADLTEVQIAQVLGWSLGTVKSRLHRARKHLQRSLTETRRR